ncbi:MAG: hypothetical protein IIZ47_03510 [Erysipelotrichaceae bacterium]|nr:hypothetical protein [Erysipelotrichaceae bacterium]
MKQKKTLFYILLDGRYKGKTYAVSEAAACRNYWWNHIKNRDQYKVVDYYPEDFEAVSIPR